MSANSVLKVLGLEYQDYPHVNDAILFMYLIKLAQGTTSNNWIHAVLLMSLRAFGGDGLVAPAVFGVNHSASPYYNKMDFYLMLVAGALFTVQFLFPRFFTNNIPANVWEYVQKVFNLCFSIIKGNVAAAGFALAAAAVHAGADFPYGANVAPYLGAFLAVNGAALLENGIAGAAEAHGSYSADFLLGVLAGPMIVYLTQQAHIGALETRCVLVAFHYSCNHITWNTYITDTCTKAFTAVKDIKLDLTTPAKTA